MIKASLLKRMANRALTFSDQKGEGQRATLERRDNLLYLSASDGNCATRIWEPDAGSNFITVVNVYALAELLSCFDADSSVCLSLSPERETKLLLSDLTENYSMAVYPTLDAYHIPAPPDWLPTSAHMNSVIQRMVVWPVKGKTPTGQAPAVMFDGGNAGIVTGHLSFLETIEEEFTAQITLMYLNKAPDTVLRYGLSGGHLFLHGENEWCMLPLDSRKLLAYKLLLDRMQKENTCGIRINVRNLLDIVAKIKSIRKAEGYLSPEEMNSVSTTFTQTSMTAKMSLGNVTTEVSSNGTFASVDCKPSELFFSALGHRSFLGDSEEIEIKIGPQMSFIAAQVGTGKVLGGLYSK